MADRRLQSAPRLREAAPQSLRPIVAAWYELAKPQLSGEHDFEECWNEFLYGWPRVKFPGGMDLVELAGRVVKGPDHAACAEKGYHNPVRRALVGLCARLQELHGDEPFFLSSHKAADDA